MATQLVVVSKVKDVAKSMDCNTAGDVSGALSEMIERVIRRGAERAKADGRKTLKARDLDPADAARAMGADPM